MTKPRRKCKSGWRRELGTSKEAQGIVTPRAQRRIRTARFCVSQSSKGTKGWEIATLLNVFMGRNKNKQGRRDVFKNRQGDR